MKFFNRLYDITWFGAVVVTSQYQPRLSSITKIFTRRISQSDYSIQIKLNYFNVDLRNNNIVFEELRALLGIGSSQMQFYLTMHSVTPKLNSSRIRADVAKQFLLAHRAISLSSLGVVLQADHRLSSTIPVKRCIRRSNTEWCIPPFALPPFYC